MLLFIRWDVNPEIFSIGNFNFRWYSLLMAVAFLLSYYMASRMIKKEGVPTKIQDNGIVYFLAGLIFGARLGHCFFYEPVYYFHHSFEVLKIWQGGLSSHGAVLGVMTSMWIYARRVNIPWFWFIDKLAVVFLLAGFFVRFGNLMNSEAYGITTSIPLGFIFERRGEEFARHPAQLYEALTYLFLFLLLYFYYGRKWKQVQPGYFTGLIFVLVFTFRFFIEFLKEGPPAFDGVNLNTGQVLSIPLVLLGAFLTIRKAKPPPGIASP